MTISLPTSTLKRLFFALSLSLFLSPGLLRAQGGGCVCTNCPQFMPDLFVGPFFISVENAANPILGQGGQGVCGVVIHFDHTAICDLSMTLTAPSGQSITLVGPIGQFCTTNGNAGTTWDVTFLPCSDPVNPDPGFSPTWNNNQPWGANNAYTGSYHPFTGCMENFFGPVNGTWTLTVNDGQPNDTGNLLDWEIIFCDPSGINCFSCAANAGNLLQDDVIECEGDPALNLNLPPTYTPPAVPPPSSEYGYSYVIGGTGGVIVAIESNADLSSYPAGNYTVCGMSYLLAQSGNIPTPNGTLTINQLTAQLNSSTPPFCGKITSNCVNVTIKPLPPDEEEFQTICAPACYSFQGVDYCQTGTYPITLIQNGCPYTATLYLTVNQPSFRTVVETICVGGCATTPGFAGACGAGQYMATFTNALGCDSIVTLNLVNINVLANITPNPPPVLSCLQPTTQLSGAGSTTGAGVTYQWTAGNGGTFSGPTNSLNAIVTSPGDYQFRVCRTQGAITCCDSTSVTVTGSQTLPNTPVGMTGDTILCPGQTTSFSVPIDTSASSYTWTVPSGVIINGGQDSALINLTWNDSSGVVCVSAVNACGTSTPFCQAVSVTALANPDSVLGAALVCVGDTVDYSVTAVSGATQYLWTAPAPAMILSGQGTTDVIVLWASGATGDLCVVAMNGCDTSQSSCLPVQVNALPGLPDIAGDSSLCVGSTGTYHIPLLPNATGYSWTVPAGGTIVSGQDSTVLAVSWTAAPGGNICAMAGNGCGFGPQDCFPVVIFSVPLANAGPDSAVCDTAITLSATASVGAGAWTLGGGPGTANFANADSTATAVTVSQNGSYTFLWTETNGLCSDVDTVLVQFNASPQTGPVVSACDSTNQNYTITFPILGGAAPYTVPGGAVLNDTFVSAPIPAGQPYSFVVTDSNGCVSPALSGLVKCNCTSDAGQMDATLLTACPGDSVTAQQTGGIFDGDDVGAYILHTNPGLTLGAILDENTSGTFGFAAGMTYGATYYISYVVGNNLNGLPDLTDPCLAVAAGQPVIFYDNPVADAGLDVAGCGLTLSVNGNPGAGTGEWSLAGTPPGGTATLATPTNASTSLTGDLFGAYTLAYTVSQNGCTGLDSVLVTFQDSPSTGALMQVCDGANQFYTVDFSINGGAAPYLVNGVAVTGTNFVSAPIASGMAYSFVVADANGCVSPAVTGSFNCACATSAGQLDLTPIAACEGEMVTANFLGGQNLDANDTLAFVLHTGSGATLGTVLAQNQSGVFGFLPGMSFGTTYYLSAAAGNNLNGLPDPADPCFSVAQGQPVVFYENPSPSAGPVAGVCGLTTTLAVVNSGFSGAWSQVSGPGTANVASPDQPGSSVTVNAAGAYVFRWTETNNLCSAFADVMIDFYPVPAISALTETCNGTNTGYVLSFTVNGGTPPFLVSGVTGSFAGTVFSSAELANNGMYNVLITDANGCTTPPLAGDHFCPCSTNAGTMVTTPAVFCADQPAMAVWNNDAILDADDSLRFVLHNQAGLVYATSNQPVFPFGPGLQTGVTYYISAVAGNSVAGQIDPNDPCFSLATGTPVQWKPLPTASLAGAVSICQGGSAVLQFAGTGTYPLTVNYVAGTGTMATLTIPGPQPVDVPLSPAVTTTYTLVSVTDGTLPACTQALSGSVTITVNTPVNAGTAAAPVAYCVGTAQLVQLGALLSGADSGGLWTETSVNPSTSGAFQAAAATFQTSGQAAGTYIFRYTVQATAPCPNQSATVTVILNALPVADAGPDQTISCTQTTAILGGPSTSAGTYSWTLQGTPAGNSAQINTLNGGTYTLLVTNAAGCTASDAVTVTVDNVPPIANRITVQPVACFGDRNGRITLDSVMSSHAPVLFSLNGGPFSQQSSFSGLAPDTYTVTLQDVNGCEWTSGALVVNEPVPMTVDLGPTIEAELGDQVLLNAETTVPFSALQSITWNPVWDSAHADTLIQSFRPLQSSRVAIDLIDTSGCSASATVLVLVDKTRKVYIPNAIQPGSVLNDRLVIFGGQDVVEVESFQIFDRWGEQVYTLEHFQPNDLSLGWDGMYRGEAAAVGVYVYYAWVVFLDGERVLFSGDLVVVR